MQALGEDLASKQSWYDGTAPVQPPLLVLVGDADCIANGESIDNSVPFSSLQNGFLPACYLPGTADSYFPVLFDFGSCSMQFLYARVIQWLYEGNFAAIPILFECAWAQGHRLRSR